MVNLSVKTKRRIKQGLLDLIVLVAFVFFLFPIFWIFFTSVKTRAQAFAFPPLWWFKPTIDNYVAVAPAETPDEQQSHRCGLHPLRARPRVPRCLRHRPLHLQGA